ncbi:unnamed protein product [Coregonus sp. 'balchen']|nr:unnamed protein product [Coregonus sp. 'balchen']
MVWCSVPGCANYKQAQAAGVTFHRLPVRDITRSRKWLAAIKNAAYDVNTALEKYPNSFGTMVGWWCTVPSCKKYKQALAKGQWLAAINVKYPMDKPISKYGGICVCSRQRIM